MSAPVVLLAQAITDLLNTVGAFTPALNATREWQPFYDLPAATTAKIAVFPSADDSSAKIDRHRWQHDLTIDVSVQRKIAADTSPEKDALVLLADQICEYIKANRPNRPEKLMTATVNPLLQNELLRQNKLFTAVARFTFQSHR